MARRRWSESQMRELLQEQERSGMSLAAFAAAGGISYTTLSWWRSRLRRTHAPQFVAVRVAEELHGVEIAVGDVVVRVPAGASAEETARLVRAIARC